MKISYKWLVELTGLDWSPQEMGDRLTLCGTACEHIQPTAEYMDKVVVGRVVKLDPVPGADKIRQATVDLGSETLTVICGAPNVAVGQKIALARVGARLAGGIELKRAKIRGIESLGMICSERELGISEDHSGILVLDDSAELGQPLVEHLDYDDHILTFELTPNRPDSMCAIGIARDLAALTGTRVRYPEFDVRESGPEASSLVSVRIDDPQVCPRYAARVIRHLKIAPSPWWLKKKLLTAGIRPISNIVDITNLVMLECGHPLHAFDLDRFGSNEVVVRRARDGELFTTLDGQEHKLTPDVTLITNGKQGVAAGGVMGGLDSEVEDSTTTVLLEAAYFNASQTRKSRRHLGLVTESSQRFEKGADPNRVEWALNRAAALMQELAGGEVLKGIVDCYPKRIDPITVKLRPERCDRILGVTTSPSRMRDILALLEFQVAGESPLSVTVPTFRPDIEREIDLIEEVGRIQGYDAIPDAVTNIGPLYTPLDQQDDFEWRVRRVLTGAGFDEMVSHGLTDSRLASVVNPGLPFVRILNPVSEDLDIMRNSLVPSTLTVLAHNLAHRNIDLRLFELGSIYRPPQSSGDWGQQPGLVMAVSGNSVHGWREQPRPYDFYDLAGALGLLCEHFHWPALSYEPTSCSYLVRDLSFAIRMGESAVGTIGLLDEKIARRAEIKQAVYLAELNLAPLMAAARDLAEFVPLPVYPAALRDLAMVVDESVPAAHITACVRDNAGELAESVEIFDLYAGRQIEAGKKSIAISISYRSREGNLTSEQVDQMQGKVIAALERDLGAAIRDK